MKEIGLDCTTKALAVLVAGDLLMMLGADPGRPLAICSQAQSLMPFFMKSI
jgi:hypothetical protein